MTEETPVVPVEAVVENPTEPSTATPVDVSEPAPTPSDVDTITSDSNTLRKDTENAAKAHINTIWQSIEDAALWPIEKIEALIEDLKKHVESL